LPKYFLNNITIIETGIATMQDAAKQPSRNPINKYVPSIAVIILYKLLGNSSTCFFLYQAIRLLSIGFTLRQ
jgi:hypothetical protein